MKNILLPTDFSDNSWNAIEYAINFHKNDTCTFYLLHTNSLSSIVTDTPYIPNSKAEDAVQCFVESRDIDMIVMVAKNLNYFQQILFHSKVEKISYHTNVPFLVLQE
jgi:hypothetical protein